MRYLMRSSLDIMLASHLKGLDDLEMLNSMPSSPSGQPKQVMDTFDGLLSIWTISMVLYGRPRQTHQSLTFSRWQTCFLWMLHWAAMTESCLLVVVCSHRSHPGTSWWTSSLSPVKTLPWINQVSYYPANISWFPIISQNVNASKRYKW